MIQLSSIKLIIWDLDDTFWSGTLSEGGITPISENIHLVKYLTDRGIINTVCSKNDYEPTMDKLRELGVAEYFVFSSIDWTPKGPRIKNLIKNMGLRPINVLFLDDNTVNLNEAKHYSPELMVAEPYVIADIIQQCVALPAKDVEHKRLKQYLVLEEKQKAKSEASDNLSFLYSTNTQVKIHKDCMAEIDRLTELVNRTNQLNFTKVRSTKEELTALLAEEGVDAGYVTVKDNFGDYGIVGFYAVKDAKCIHFLFSCRTIGQGVEQYVYSTLGWPELNVVGNVVNNVARVEAPKWINQKVENQKPTDTKKCHKIVIKGACDLSIMSSFLSSDNIVTEFTFLGQLRKNEIEHHNHSVNYLTMPFLSEEQRKEIVEECIFCDPEMFDTHMYDSDVDIVFLSSLPEPNLGIYRNKKTGIEIAFAEHCYSLTNPEIWPLYHNGEAYAYMNNFTEEWLKSFAEEWEYVGRMTPERYVEQLKTVLSKIAPSAIVCVMLGSETPREEKERKPYENRHLDHIAFNKALRQFASENDRLKLIDLNEFIHGQNDFTNNINHFQRRVYFDVAKKANEYIALATGEKVVQKGKLYLLREDIAQRIRESKLRDSFLYKILKLPYRLLQFIKK